LDDICTLKWKRYTMLIVVMVCIARVCALWSKVASRDVSKKQFLTVLERYSTATVT
jgi:hypothetical protein